MNTHTTHENFQLIPPPVFMSCNADKASAVSNRLAIQLDNSVFINDIHLWLSRISAFTFEMADTTENMDQTGISTITIKQEIQLGKEAYTLKINAKSIELSYGDRAGLFYATVTLKQLYLLHKGSLPECFIEDSPRLPLRGVMLDISRDKIPTLETLTSYVELLADLKYNHLELYIEGFSFAYPSFRALWEASETPLTSEELRALDTLCTSLCIDLVPNQNCLGHMGPWLATEEFHGLSECPDGIDFMGERLRTTLNPADPRSLALIEEMSRDLLPNFSSSSFNVNLDEPFELGKGVSSERVAIEGLGNVYLGYVLKIYELVVTKLGKSMLMWGDIISRHPDILQGLPKDITVIDWGYEAFYDFSASAQRLQKSGFPFILAPGTSSWTSFTGRTENMRENIRKAVAAAVAFDAKGVLLTDWGDMGHLQYPAVSYPGFVLAGSLCWNPSVEPEIENYISRIMYEDQSGLIGELILSAGNFSKYEELQLCNGTVSSLLYRVGFMEYQKFTALLDSLGAESISALDSPDLEARAILNFYQNQTRYTLQEPACQDLFSEIDLQLSFLAILHGGNQEIVLTCEEYRNAFRWIKASVLTRLYMEISGELMSTDTSHKQSLLQNAIVTLQEAIAVHGELWLQRNKAGGLERSLRLPDRLLEHLLQEQGKYTLS